MIGATANTNGDLTATPVASDPKMWEGAVFHAAPLDDAAQLAFVKDHGGMFLYGYASMGAPNGDGQYWLPPGTVSYRSTGFQIQSGVTATGAAIDAAYAAALAGVHAQYPTILPGFDVSRNTTPTNLPGTFFLHGFYGDPTAPREVYAQWIDTRWYSYDPTELNAALTAAAQAKPAGTTVSSDELLRAFATVSDTAPSGVSKVDTSLVHSEVTAAAVALSNAATTANPTVTPKPQTMNVAVMAYAAPIGIALAVLVGFYLLTRE